MRIACHTAAALLCVLLAWRASVRGDDAWAAVAAFGAALNGLAVGLLVAGDAP